MAERRCQTFAQAQALEAATVDDADLVTSEFLEFFEQTGVGLFRDEEEWILRTIRPAPEAFLGALEDHLAISSMIRALLAEAQAGCVDLRVLHRLGDVLERHLLMEEEQVRPLVTQSPRLAFPS